MRASRRCDWDHRLCTGGRYRILVESFDAGDRGAGDGRSAYKMSSTEIRPLTQ